MRLQKIAQQNILDKIGLSSVSVKILFIIDSAPITSSSDILHVIGGTRSNISQRLSFLEKKGYVARNQKPSKTDKRVINLSLTPLGEKKLLSIKQWITKANICIEKYFTPEELAAHRAFFIKLNTVLDQEIHAQNVEKD
jgi:DNA-binding MarR family transcriptional regulator